MKILSLNIPMKNGDSVERLAALLSLRNWVSRMSEAGIQNIPLIHLDAEFGEPLTNVAMTEKDAENLRGLLVWADLYFVSTGNTKNDYALDRLHKIFGNPPVQRRVNPVAEEPPKPS